jgi:hypothetical protein
LTDRARSGDSSVRRNYCDMRAAEAASAIKTGVIGL